MSYESTRRTLTLRHYYERIRQFANRYRKGRPTIVLLPGGAGSQLVSTRAPYRDDKSVLGSGTDIVWIDLGILLEQDVLRLQIRDDGLDVGRKIIFADGELRFLVSPYDATFELFAQKGWNWIVFGFDWRRPVPEAAKYLETFLRVLSEQVRNRHGEDPLPRTTLLCHSLGGLVATAFLHRVFPTDGAQPNPQKWLDRVITVGTPFYGTANHMMRLYRGEALPNVVYGPSAIAKTCGSHPGPYVLLTLDRSTYARDGAALGLTAYPMTDADAPGTDLDPYNAAHLARYPSWVSAERLRAAQIVVRTITSPLPASVSQRVFHLRTRGLLPSTAVSLRWRNVNGRMFNPDDASTPDPVIPGTMGYGDGSVPYWSGRLAQTDAKRVYDLQWAVDHVGLLQHAETLQVLTHIVESGSPPATILAVPELLGQAVATAEDAGQFVKDIASGVLGLGNARLGDREMWGRVVQGCQLC